MKRKRSVFLVMATVMVLSATPMQDHAQEPRPDRRVEIVAERFSFVPSRIRVQRGTTVEFVLTSDDTYHGFSVPDFNVNLLISPWGEAATVRITFPEAGEYVFECSRPCGAGHNLMRGVIVVG
jgi:cytochrome c oxidase subunit 2